MFYFLRDIRSIPYRVTRLENSLHSCSVSIKNLEDKLYEKVVVLTNQLEKQKRLLDDMDRRVNISLAESQKIFRILLNLSVLPASCQVEDEILIIQNMLNDVTAVMKAKKFPTEEQQKSHEDLWHRIDSISKNLGRED